MWVTIDAHQVLKLIRALPLTSDRTYIMTHLELMPVAWQKLTFLFRFEFLSVNRCCTSLYLHKENNTRC